MKTLILEQEFEVLLPQLLKKYYSPDLDEKELTLIRADLHKLYTAFVLSKELEDYPEHEIATHKPSKEQLEKLLAGLTEAKVKQATSLFMQELEKNG